MQRAEIKRIREIEKSKYLQLDLKVKDIVEDYLLVTVTIENRSDEAKEIANTLLLVAPEKERPIESYNLLVKEHNLKEAKNTNDIAEYRIDNPICSDGRFLIPAPFFYLENARIADERLSYTVPIEIKDLPEGMPYSIRLFVREPMSKEEKDQKKEGRLHRTTHDLFIVPYRNN